MMNNIKDQDFIDLNDSLKNQDIGSVYQELSDPTHPDFIAMEKMKTNPEIRIIEGLDK